MRVPNSRSPTVHVDVFDFTKHSLLNTSLLYIKSGILSILGTYNDKLLGPIIEFGLPGGLAFFLGSCRVRRVCLARNVALGDAVPLVIQQPTMGDFGIVFGLCRANGTRRHRDDEGHRHGAEYQPFNVGYLHNISSSCVEPLSSLNVLICTRLLVRSSASIAGCWDGCCLRRDRPPVACDLTSGDGTASYRLTRMAPRWQPGASFLAARLRPGTLHDRLVTAQVDLVKAWRVAE